MPQQYDNRLTGTLFKAKQKKGPKSPDYNGSFTDENGDEFWVSGWIKEAKKSGEKFISLAFNRKDEQAQARGRGQSAYSEAPEDDTPF